MKGILKAYHTESKDVLKTTDVKISAHFIVSLSRETVKMHQDFVNRQMHWADTRDIAIVGVGAESGFTNPDSRIRIHETEAGVWNGA